METILENISARPDSTETPRPSPQIARLFLWALLGTVAMLFMALISAYLVRRSGADWQAVHLPAILWWNALLLIPGTLAMNAATRTSSRSGGTKVRRWLCIAGCVGILFVAGQAYGWKVWASQGIFLSTNPYSSFFYLFSGLHAAHVLGGVVWLIVLLAAYSGSNAPKAGSAAVRCAADYWLFLALVWLALLGVLTCL